MSKDLIVKTGTYKDKNGDRADYLREWQRNNRRKQAEAKQ